jgi:trehalose 6-phosphate phosphatase
MKEQYKGAIFDMDGVITQTAKVHARAWKELFDGFLKEHEGSSFKPFDINSDYKRYIDGKPRLDGIRSFLESRNISLKEGKPGEKASKTTVHDLSERKNSFFLSVLEKEGVEVYPDAQKLIRRWKGQRKLAVISASKNCEFILTSVGMLDRFDARVDGIISERRKLKGKPEPDIFLEAARLLELQPAECMIFEDAIAGVQAGKKGGFGLVVGVARDGEEEDLLENGADFVISSFELIENKLNGYV